MKNPAFWRAIHSLAHPVSLLAILALLLNDHFLRIHTPSWLTGKLGDFAWLVFAPFICAAVFAWLIRVRQQEKVVGIAAFTFIGVWFTLAKTTPLVHGWTLDALEMVVGYRGTLRIDPTDLLTLPALVLGWYVWRSVDNTSQTLKPRAWTLLALGTFATVATSPPFIPFPDIGINCVVQQSPQILRAYSVDASFISHDSGLIWDSINQRPNNLALQCSIWTNSVNYLAHDGQIFRFQDGIGIDVYAPSKQMWVTEFDLSAVDFEARRLYHEEQYLDSPSTTFSYEPGPFSAIVDTQTGNLVVAMGHDGVLVRTPDGRWQWVGVGQYQYPEFHRVAVVVEAITIDLLIGFFVLLLTPITLYRPSHDRRDLFIWLLIGWACWFVIMMVDHHTADNGVLVAIWVAIAGGCVACFCSAISIFDTARRFARALIPFAVTGLTAALLFVLPFVLWTQGTVPTHFAASVYGTLLAGVTLLSGRLHLAYFYPALYKQKRKALIEELLAAGEIVFEEDEDFTE